jgi:hypothetical protein
MEVEREEAAQMIVNNKHNCITTTYYLLDKKRIREPQTVVISKVLGTDSSQKK